MNFVNPALVLAGLACVAIPIVIHLLMRRRRRPVEWAAMRFLLEAYRQQRRRLRLEQLLLLAARCLVIALVALALGRPFFGEAAAFGGRSAMTLYLLVDNGLASMAEAEGRSALDRHKEAAANLLAQLDSTAGDRAALVALGGPAQPLVSPPTSDTGALADVVRNLQPTQSATDLAGGLAYIAGELGDDQVRSRTVIAVLSDFLEGSADPEQALMQLNRAGDGAGRDMVLLASRPAEEGVENISITGVEPLRPVIIASRGEQEHAASTAVRIRLQRSGVRTNEAGVTTVRLAIENGRGERIGAGQAVARWSPGQTEATVSVPMDTSRLPSPRAGSAEASVVLTATIDPDAIDGDNTWRRPVEIRRGLRVGVVSPRRLGTAAPGEGGLQRFTPSDWIRLALAPTDDGLRTIAGEGEIEVLEIEPTSLDATRLAGLDVAVLVRPDLVPEPAWTRLRSFADAGGLIVIMPPDVAQVHLWPDSMARELGVNWNVAREARVYEEPMQIATDRLEADAGGAGLLALLGAELPELAPPVGITRVLPVEAQVTEGEEARQGRQPGTLLQLQDGSPLLLFSPPGVREDEGGEAPPARGLVVFLSTAFNFDWTDLHARPLMVPLMHEIVRQGVGQAIGTRVQIAGGRPHIPSRTVELVAAGEAPAGARSVVRPDVTGQAEEPLRHAGLWNAMDERGVARAMIAVNPDPAAGRAGAQPAQTIREWLARAIPGDQSTVYWLDDFEAGAPAQAGGLHAIFERRADDAMFALPLLIAALLLAFTELFMARWFSHATRPAGEPVPART